MSLKEKIKQQSHELLNEITAIRRYLHAHPELSFQEIETSKYICALLDKWNINYTTGWVKTGIVAIIKGKNAEKKCIALRADIDALPIQEIEGRTYGSKNKGVMHACGHDVHTASLLGAAKILNNLKNTFEGSIKLIFQPGEELLPGGASLMIKEGVLKKPNVESIFGQHVFPSLQAGKVGFRKGMYMASTDELYFTVIGKGGHAAMPADYNNPIFIAGEIIKQLHTFFMEKKTNDVPTVIAFGKFTANGATNVIPEKVSIEGTFRTMNEAWRKKSHEKIIEIATSVAQQMNGKCEIDIRKGYPFLSNDEYLTEKAINFAKEFLGDENVIDLDLRMTAEDFAFYSQEIPACFYRLGTANFEKGIIAGVHTPQFDIDEKALEIGMGLMAYLALKELSI
ncbi:MAG: M20 family metallopeptidase [Bacteroidia bacterium]